MVRGESTELEKMEGERKGFKVKWGYRRGIQRKEK